MVKWFVNWSEAQSHRVSTQANNGIVWAVIMPESYPECRVTRRGIAHIAVTDEESIATALQEDGGEVKLVP